jgi:hypothetical protein
MGVVDSVTSIRSGLKLFCSKGRRGGGGIDDDDDDDDDDDHDEDDDDDSENIAAEYNGVVGWVALENTAARAGGYSCTGNACSHIRPKSTAKARQQYI